MRVMEINLTIQTTQEKLNCLRSSWIIFQLQLYGACRTPAYCYLSDPSTGLKSESRITEPYSKLAKSPTPMFAFVSLIYTFRAELLTFDDKE